MFLQTRNSVKGKNDHKLFFFFANSGKFKTSMARVPYNKLLINPLFKWAVFISLES